MVCNNSKINHQVQPVLSKMLDSLFEAMNCTFYVDHEKGTFEHA